MKRETVKQSVKLQVIKTKSTLKNFAQQYKIEGLSEFDPKSFFEAVTSKILELLNNNKQTKVKLILNCKVKRIDLKTGEVIIVDVGFYSEIEVNLDTANVAKLYQKLIEESLEKMANFQRRGRSWQFELVNSLEIHLLIINH